MRLDSLFQVIPTLDRIHWDPHLEIRKVTSDSRLVEKGDVFVACSGSRMDGHDFLAQAIQAGASVIVFERKPDFFLPPHLIAVRVQNSSQVLALLLKRFYGAPDEKMKLIGVAGTNGKTTIAYLLNRLLKEKVESAYLGTLGYEISSQMLEASNTTPGPETLFHLLHELQKQGVKYCFMEVSSHALAQYRVFGLQFELVIFTQLTQDHLDYHKTMERYFQAKRLLFAATPAPRQILINRDCSYGRRLLDEFLEAKSYAVTAPADYRVQDVSCSWQGSHFRLKYPKSSKATYKIRMPMRHNVSNMLAILSALHMLGFDPEEFRPFVQELPGVPGRLERVIGNHPFDVFVDYAHTPDAFEQVLSAAKEMQAKRVLTLFGCGGDRDQQKRPLMAAVAAKYSDIVVLTSDNPRSEDPENILMDIRKGIPASGEHVPQIIEVLDRRQAIQKVLSIAEPGDVIFILGKGHEDYQILGDQKIPFDDRLVVKECLKKKNRVFSA